MTKMQIMYFLKSAELESFTKAAEILFVTQPTITQQIRSLEDELGFKLFLRKNRSIELTDEGREMYQAFSKMSLIFDAALVNARSIMDGKMGRINVGVLPMCDTKQFVKKINTYCNSFPGRSVEYSQYHLEELIAHLNAGDLDMAVLYDDLFALNPELEYIPFVRCEYVYVLSADDPLAEKEYVTTEELKDKTFILSTYPSLDFLDKSDSFFRKLGLDTMAKIQKVESVELSFSLVASSGGCAFTCGSDHNKVLSSPDYRLFPTGLEQNMCIAWNPNRLKPFAEALIRDVFGASA